MTLDELNAQLRETNRVMTKNLVEELYGDNALADYLSQHGCKSVKWSVRGELARWRGRVGRLFLRAANLLGEYNEYD